MRLWLTWFGELAAAAAAAAAAAVAPAFEN